MLTIFTANTNSSCRKAIKFFKDYNISYAERKISAEVPFTEKELLLIFEKTDDIYDILSTRKYGIKFFESMHIKSDLIPFVLGNHDALKFPIILTDKFVQSGFHEDKFRVFVSKEVRKEELTRMLAQLYSAIG